MSGHDLLLPGATEGTAFLMAALAGDKEKIDRIFADLVAASFKTHPMRHCTDNEVRRRGTILITWFRILRGEKGWPLDRVLHELRRVLRAELNGETYTPSESVLYRVDDDIETMAAELRASQGPRTVGYRS